MASAIYLIVQISRLKDCSRKITAITEVIGMEGDTITLQDIFVFEPQGADATTGRIQGVFRPTGIRPQIINRLFDRGVPLPGELARLFPDRRMNQVPTTFTNRRRQ